MIERKVPLRILLVIKNALLRAGVRRALANDARVEVVAEAASTGQAAAALVDGAGPDVVLFAPCACTAEAHRHLRQMAAQAPQAVLVALDEGVGTIDLLPPGVAIRTIPSCIEPGQLAEALRAVVVRRASPASVQPPTSGLSVPGLTQRELEVLKAVAQGRTNREVAVDLCLSEHTVKFHLGRIYRKLRLRSRAEAAFWLLENGAPG